MSYFSDLTDYTYSRWDNLPNTRNVGWLDAAHPFEQGHTPDEILDKLWRFCGCSIAQTRGFHVCELTACIHQPENRGPLEVSRNGETLRLGSSEMRVFGQRGIIYAAPNLIYHYVTAHRYKMPDEFVAALNESLSPEEPEYFERLRQLGIKWSTTLRPN